MTTTPTPIDPAQLPEVIIAFLAAHQAGDIARALGGYRPDATVTDDGKTYHGHDEIRAWLSRSATEFTYTVEMTGATKLDRDHFDATHHLEGNFPGGQVDLHCRFALRDGEIAELVIEP
jgi:ketosteroid isomerase-like protein